MKPPITTRSAATIALTATLASIPSVAHAAPINCYSCDVMTYSLSIIQQTIDIFPQQLATNLWPLIIVVVIITSSWEILKSMAGGYSVIMPIMHTFARMIILSALLAGPTNFGSTINSLIAGPAIDLGSAAGSLLASAAATSTGFSQPVRTCTYTSASTAGITQSSYIDADTNLTNLICQIQSTVMIPYIVGTMIVSQHYRSGVIGDVKVGLIYGIAGLFIMYLSFTMMLEFTLTMFEAILRLGIVLTFSPVIAFLWLYKSTRGAVYNTFTNLMFMMVYLAMTGLGAAVIIILIMTGIKLGAGLPATSSATPDMILSGLQTRLTAGATINNPGTMAGALIFVAYTSVSIMIATGVHRGIHNIARMVTQYQGGGASQRTLATAAVNSINTVAQTALASVAGVGAAAGGAAAGALAKLF